MIKIFLHSLIKCLNIVIIIIRIESHVSIMKSQTVEDVMNAISDSKSLDMFCSIAKESIESEVLKKQKD